MERNVRQVKKLDKGVLLHVSDEFSARLIVHDTNRKLAKHEGNPNDTDENCKDKLYMKVPDIDTARI